MGKVVTDGFLDGGLDAISTASQLTITTAEPTSLAECDSLSLIPSTLVSSGDFTKANGDASGRKVTIAQQSTLTIDNTGTATHVVLRDASDYYVTTCTSQALTSGGTVTVPAWDIEFADPT